MVGVDPTSINFVKNHVGDDLKRQEQYNLSPSEFTDLVSFKMISN